MKLGRFSKLASILIVTLLVSCSMKKKSDPATAQAGVEVGAENSLVEGDEFADLEEVSEESLDEEISEDLATTDSSYAKPIIQETEAIETPMVTNSGGEFNTYTVQKGDTYMLVAYKVYADYSKWRDIADLNGGGALVPGSQVRYRSAWQSFPIKTQGAPYIIQNGDTLGGISQNKYGTVKKWRNIYDNNKQLIKDPNLIFAGFTLYLPGLNEVALLDLN